MVVQVTVATAVQVLQVLQLILGRKEHIIMPVVDNRNCPLHPKGTWGLESLQYYTFVVGKVAA